MGADLRWREGSLPFGTRHGRTGGLGPKNSVVDRQARAPFPSKQDEARDCQQFPGHGGRRRTDWEQVRGSPDSSAS